MRSGMRILMNSEHIASAKVTSRGQIALPKEIRKMLGGVEKGDYLLFYDEKGRVYIEKGKITPVSRK